MKTTSNNNETANSDLGAVDISISTPAELAAEPADAYCPNCEAYIINERVTYEECCDNCGANIEWHE